jgi:YggT family protein
MLLALLGIVSLLLTVLWWIIVIQAIMSWLIIFNVINMQSDFVRALATALDKITEPLYRPIRRVMPDFGGIDFTPLVVLLIIVALDLLLQGAARDLVASGY